MHDFHRECVVFVIGIRHRDTRALSLWNEPVPFYFVPQAGILLSKGLIQLFRSRMLISTFYGKTLLTFVIKNGFTAGKSGQLPTNSSWAFEDVLIIRSSVVSTARFLLENILDSSAKPSSRLL